MNHEHEHSRASSPAAVAVHNDAIEPGQSSRSALLRKSDHPVASGLVQRKARDANGVTDGAEHAVAAASASSGSPLPATLMRRFESSLGADLSSVRVHTGGASEHAADAVGAKAYTMGNDIHFGAGHYDPVTPGGQHLIAHEVAHTVQQSGGVQRMQCKFDVSSPGDSLEHEADRAADAMVSGGAAAVSRAIGLSRYALHRKPAELDGGVHARDPVAPAPSKKPDGADRAGGDLVSLVAARAGEIVEDGGKYKYRVLPQGSFEIVEAPPENKKSLHQVITFKGLYADPWKAIARKLLAKAPPQKAGTPSSAPQPVVTAVTRLPPPPEDDDGSAIGSALDFVEEEVDAVVQGAQDLWCRMLSAVASSRAPSASKVPPSPAVTPAKAPVTAAGSAEPKPAAKPKTTKTKRQKWAGSKEGLSEGDKKYRTLEPTMQGSTLDIASTRATLGNERTKYTFDVGNSLIDGDPDATKFYCSGLSIWTLSAAGYNVNEPIRGADGEPYSYTLVKPNPDKTAMAKEPEVEEQQYVTLKQILDGEPAAVEAMILVEQNKMTNGGWIARVKSEKLGGAGHSIGYSNGDPAKAVRGAAAAFEYAKIGCEVPEQQQKPGDFVQTRHKESHREKRNVEKTGRDGKTKTVNVVADDQRGFGHAWQVWKVTALGSAVFGKPGSPEPVDGVKRAGWQGRVLFVIDKDTDPSLVGEHEVKSAMRLEANVATAGDADGNPMGGDGGVQLTGYRPVPDTEKGTDHHVFVGRLGTSKWANCQAVTKESTTIEPTKDRTTDTPAKSAGGEARSADTPSVPGPLSPPPLIMAEPTYSVDEPALSPPPLVAAGPALSPPPLVAAEPTSSVDQRAQ